MCGIAGLVGDGAGTEALLTRMLDRIKLRGPDDLGIWSEGDLFFGHRRLSVIDLSPAGHQPMMSASGNLVLVYNGEIYNFNELRDELNRSPRCPRWRGHSDTEILLACMEAWGIDATLRRCNGMFAFALWNKAERTLTLARDRMGEKPLYFGWPTGRFAFASELKALCALPGWEPKTNEEAISRFLSVGYIRGVQSAIDGIYRLPPGSILTIRATEFHRAQTREDFSRQIAQYWSLQDVATNGLHLSGMEDEEASLNALDGLLHDAIAKRMVADVPIGSFLSGGIDSSLISAIMQRQSDRKIQTFSIGFDESGYNEAHHAKAVAEHIGSEHTELYFRADQTLALVPRLAEAFDEPFADSSQLPSLLVSELARKKVTVALSGDGGDELFAGYGRYVSILRMWKWLHHSGSSVQYLSKSALSLLASASSLLAPHHRTWPQRLKRLHERVQFSHIDDLRLAFIAGAGFTHIQSSTFGKNQRETPVSEHMESPLRRLMLGDQIDYLPDNILHKVDRASMAYSLETRIPLLDHRIVELSWRMRESMLLSGRIGKLPLRNLLTRYVPSSLIDRPKQGFSPPIAHWLRGPLKDWAETLLSPHSLRELPLIHVPEVRKLWLHHMQCRIDASQVLWNILMLCNWRAHMKVRCSS